MSTSSSALSVTRGRPVPLGATVLDRGTQFALFSRHATAVSLLLFEDAATAEPTAEISLDRTHHRTGDIWHVLARGVGPGWCYLYRVDGPFAPRHGHRFDAQRLLFDPYAKAFTGAMPARRRAAELPSEQPRCVVVDTAFNWRDDRHPRHPLHRSVVYEVHARGFTAHPSAGRTQPGTFLGLCERIPHLRSLGVTAVELLPVHESDEYAPGGAADPDAAPLVNYWGYNPIGLFAPKRRYSAATEPGGQVTEFKQMVRELHAAGIEIILDMVFNHSPEGDAAGPTLSYRGLDNSIYYLLDPGDRSRYLDFTGCRNTLNCNHPVVRRMIIDCLHYWVVEMHVDGFRFDLASVLGRDRSGNLSANTPILEQIGEDPVLRDTKIIAEAWDAAGAYQVGKFPGDRWAELNDRFRNDVRRFWRGDGTAAALATRLAGSADLYQGNGRRPAHSINFITCHDGFTLHDLVSYAAKHNHANGEGNRDGSDHNLSANHGVEGPTDDAAIGAVRLRQSKNLLATLFLSLGTPLLLGGDELARTQRGNNNAYCHDNELSWFDWTPTAAGNELSRFCRALTALRATHPALHRDAFYPDPSPGDDGVRWYAAGGGAPDWEQEQSCLAACLSNPAGDLYLILNAATRDRPFAVPAAPHGGAWRRTIDTALPPPDDISPLETGLLITPQESYDADARSLVLLAASPDLGR
ncbi:MAG: glycogen debranching protein GlgX [Spirochaetaceae bacterium]|nr:glycogen debranching protein GlgX [Spirochaetaceae bacterium]